MGSDEDTTTIKLSNGQNVNHTSYGSNNSPNKAGGFVMFYPRNFDEIYDYINDPNVLTVNWADCVIQITHVNRNNNFMSIDQVIFQKLLSGEIDKKYLFQTTADHYDSGLDYFRLFLELILLLMI